MEKKLEVKNLTVSFRTAGGKVQAVRGVSFDLYKGETLAIVGESGSGKSVSTRAVMGILAGNATVESGEILYEGKDLLKIPEEEMHKIRGDEIAMIFQDPLSALDPIMRVGKQITEAMLLKNKTARRRARRKLKTRFSCLKKEIASSRLGETEKERAQKNLSEFRKAALRKEPKEQIQLLFSLLQTIEKETGWAKKTVEEIEELILQSRKTVTKKSAKERAIRLMEEVGISEAKLRFSRYPFEFSGGMRQRIVIAIALAGDPKVLICDEPTTALDVSVQAQILELLERLKKERALSVIFITHDLGVVASVADRVAVMYAGKIVEWGETEEIFYEPKHPYTWALLSATPDLETGKEKLYAIPGSPPNMINPPKGDAFAERNEYAMEIDFEREPPSFEVSKTHYAATWLLHPLAPKVSPPEAVLKRIRTKKSRRKKD